MIEVGGFVARTRALRQFDAHAAGSRFEVVWCQKRGDGAQARRRYAQNPGAQALDRTWHDPCVEQPRCICQFRKGHDFMIRYAVVFLVIALVAALLGFGGLAGLAASIAKILFFVFLVLAAISLVVNLMGGRGRSSLL